MTDFHSHLLPGIDDGSRNIEMTCSMLEEAMRQDVGRIIATPHFYADRNSVDQFLMKRDTAVHETLEALTNRKQKAPEIRIGAEVYYFSGIGKAARLSELCIDGTGTILIEMPFYQWDKEMLSDLTDILEKQQLKVVLAHVERYPEFQKKKDIWEAVLDMPVTAQINTGSFLKKGGFFSRDKKRQFCLSFLEERPETVLGSDCHNMDSRRPNLLAGRQEIERTLGKEALRASDAAAEKLL